MSEPCRICGKSQVEDLFLIEYDLDRINEAITAGYILVHATIAGTSERGYPVALVGRRHACL